MTILAEMFEYYLKGRFKEGVEFQEVGGRALSVVYPIEDLGDGRRYSQTIVIRFEESVVREFQAAIDAKNEPRKDRIGGAICDLVQRRLSEFDERGPREAQFRIRIDDAAARL